MGSGDCSCDTRKCLTPFVERQKVVLIPLWERREGQGRDVGGGAVGVSEGWGVIFVREWAPLSFLSLSHTAGTTRNTQPLGLWWLNHALTPRMPPLTGPTFTDTSTDIRWCIPSISGGFTLIWSPVVWKKFSLLCSRRSTGSVLRPLLTCCWHWFEL